MMTCANALTLSRILLSLLLAGLTPFSVPFYIIYIAAGMTDVLDGYIARKTCTVSALGAQLDTLADFVFVVVCLIKIVPRLSLPAGLYVWIMVIALVKIGHCVIGYVKEKRIVVWHTVMNKMTGVLLFMWVLVLPRIHITYSAVIMCMMATAAAFEEGYCLMNGRFDM